MTISSSSCSYSSGDWVVNLSDSCVLSTNANIYPYTFRIMGDNGTLIINSTIQAKRIEFTPPNINGDSRVFIPIGK